MGDNDTQSGATFAQRLGGESEAAEPEAPEVLPGAAEEVPPGGAEGGEPSEGAGESGEGTQQGTAATAALPGQPAGKAGSVEPGQQPGQTVPLATLMAEKDRRRQLEEELQVLRAGTTQQQSESAVGFDDDPEAYVNSQVAQIRQEMKTTTINRSEEAAKARHKDAADVFSVFNEHVRNKPNDPQNVALVYSCLEAADPGEAMYIAGQRLQFEKHYGTSPEQIKEKLRAELSLELRPKIKAELETELFGKAKDRGNQPPNIAAGRAAGGGTTSQYVGQSFAERLASQRKARRSR